MVEVSQAKGKGPAGMILSRALLVLIGLIITALIVPRVTGRSTSGRAKIASDVSEIRSALNRFRLACGRLPTDTEGLAVLIDAKGIKGWAGPFLEKQLTDTWGRPYQYKILGQDKFEVWSHGSDGKPGGEGEAEDIGLDLSTPTKG